MKPQKLLLLIALFGSMGCTPVAAQGKKDTSTKMLNVPQPKSRIHGTLVSADTSESYSLKYKEVQLMYDLLSAGYQGVSTSDNFSKNQAKQYMQLVQHIDSLLKPQILKWHPVKTEPKK